MVFLLEKEKLRFTVAVMPIYIQYGFTSSTSKVLNKVVGRKE